MKAAVLLCSLLFPLMLSAQQCVVERLGDWVPDSVTLQGSMQGMAIHGRYAVTLRHGGQCVVLDLKQKRCVCAYQLTGNTTHCNNASFLMAKHQPLLYVSSCFGDKACHVTKILDGHSVTIQKIFFDSDCFPVAQDWCVDAEKRFIYAYGGRKGGTLYLKKFRLPSHDDIEVHLTDNDVLQTIPITCVKVAQGSKIKDGYAYLPDGDEPGNYYLHIIELATGKEVRTIDLNPIGLEPEGVDIAGRWIYVSFNTRNPKDNRIYRFKK